MKRILIILIKLLIINIILQVLKKKVIYCENLKDNYILKEIFYNSNY